MAPIPIKSIHYLDDSRITDVKLISNDSLLDADILLWNIDNSYGEIPAKQGIIESAKFDRIINRLEARKKDFAEFLERGRILIVEVPIEPIRKITVLETSEKKELNLLSMIDIETLPLEAESGEFTTISENKILQDFTYNQRVIFRYKFRFKSNIGDPLLYINKTSYSVGQFIRRGRGYILFLPPLLYAHDRTTKDAFIYGLFSLKDHLPKKVDIVKLETPKWVDNYLLEGESEELQKLKALESELREINDKILHQKRQLEFFKDLKLLVYGSGEELEKIVESIFTDLGFKIHEKENNRDDLIISMKEKTAVIEIKGVKGSAGEKNAAQLEKWVSMHLDKFDKTPKGILIINAFKETPISERNDPAFPDQMLRYSNKREHCLVTGEVLLRMYLAFKNNRLSIEMLTEMLFETVGPLVYDA